jgi:(4-(4-[2-(gamma-L-glutamylamino)ethyl]phenoxymethyl)furan-2-yl)methanamine synthase
MSTVAACPAILMIMSEIVIGLDIGGANLKAATAAGEARSRPFELWKRPDDLGEALLELLQDWAPSRLAVTMTGELCDCFENKRDGVRRILAEVERAFPGVPIGVWSTNGSFEAPETARREYLQVAAANWHALATVTATMGPRAGSAILLDVGSTTADIIPLVDGVPAPLGRTDVARLQSRELVYTGARRTPICAFAPESTMAELFATTQDAYLLLGKIPENAADTLTADGRPATIEHAHARMARMLGGDAETIAVAETIKLAALVFEKQRRLLVEALHAVCCRLPQKASAVILSGSGEWLARAAWEEFASGPTTMISLTEKLGPAASTAACAYAVAALAQTPKGILYSNPKR